MNKKNNNNTEPKRDKKVPVACITCLHAHLHRYDSNPILAACHAKPQPGNERFPFVVEVAIFLRLCNDYDHDPREKTVEHRTRRQAV